jgi:hypothetical protein
VKLKDIYDFFVKEGIASDLRTRPEIRKKLFQTHRKFRKLDKLQKSLFDHEGLKNPYADTRILYGQPDDEVRRILVGIDMEVAEILLADRLREKGRGVDLVLAHHPEGKALAALDDVMDLQINLLERLGLKYEVAKNLTEQRIQEVARRLHAGNHTRSVDAAKLLEIPFMCCHTPSDNHVARYLQKIMDTRKPKTLQTVLDLLLKEPEYKDAVRNNSGPRILLGHPKDKAGKIVVDMTGGTEGSKDIFARLSQAGVTTLLGMHLSEEHFSRVPKANQDWHSPRTWHHLKRADGGDLPMLMAKS